MCLSCWGDWRLRAEERRALERGGKERSARKEGDGEESKRQKGGKREGTGGKESCIEGIEEEAQKEAKR